MSTVGNIQRLVPGLIEPTGGTVKLPADKAAIPEENFTELLGSLLDSVNNTHTESAEIQQALLNGENVELHEVMIKLEEAGLATDLFLEVRNKLLAAYSELMRMPL
ncbi:MAG: flagellar hook-basal body complex protein FliE [bacterium]|nr:flagellar hook-basal body complex protein FliE [bacterium]